MRIHFYIYQTLQQVGFRNMTVVKVTHVLALKILYYTLNQLNPIIQLYINKVEPIFGIYPKNTQISILFHITDKQLMVALILN